MDNIIKFKSLVNKKDTKQKQITMTESQIPLTINKYKLFKDKYHTKQEVIEAFYSGESFKIYLLDKDDTYVEYRIKFACLFTQPNETIFFSWPDKETGEYHTDKIKVNPLKINFFRLLSKLDLRYFAQRTGERID